MVGAHILVLRCNDTCFCKWDFYMRINEDRRNAEAVGGVVGMHALACSWTDGMRNRSKFLRAAHLYVYMIRFVEA
jgi:hypothetical protein